MLHVPAAISRLLTQGTQLIAIVFCLCLMRFAPAQTAQANEVPQAVDAIMRRSPIPLEEMSLWIAPVDSGSPVVNWNSEVQRKPASVAKVITTGMGLLLLGDDYRWRTEFYTNGQLKAGVLEGDLFIKGYGDPYLVEEDMQSMVIDLRNLGINHLSGRVVLDNSYFACEFEHPDAFDGHGLAPYNALPNALNVNFRTAKLIFENEGGHVRVSTEPKLSYLHIDNQMRQNKSRACQGKGFSPQLEIDRASQTLTVLGEISHRCPQRTVVSVIGDSGDLFYGHFKKAWELTGGTMTDGWLYGQIPAKARLLYTGLSKPLAEQIAAMNKHSNNVMTRQLFLTIGAELTQPPATLTKSRAVVKHRLMKMGVDVSQLFIDNGAGLSRSAHINARQLGHFLQQMGADQRVAPFFLESLSVVGVDGTLRGRLRNTPLAGNAVGKTGTLDGVKSLAGYLTTKNGRQFVYVILLEGKRAKTGRPLMDEVMLWLYNNY